MKLLALVLYSSIAATAAFLSHPPAIKVTTELRMANVPSNNQQDVARRAFVRSALRSSAGIAASLALPTMPVYADSGSKLLESYVDTECGFQLMVPSGWERTEQTLPDRRRLVLFVDPSSGDDDKTILFIAYTPVRDDFTSLGSFGSVDQVAQTTILPKGSLAGEETASEMISAESKKNAYVFDYKAKVPKQPERHFRTIFALAQGATGGAGGVLVTLTAQTPETRYVEMKGFFDEMIDSYGKVK